MDFAEFAERYQRRTAKRMEDFEAVLRETQRKMEVTAQQQAIARQRYPQRQPMPVPRGEYGMPRRKAAGQVRSVLRREGPGVTGPQGER